MADEQGTGLGNGYFARQSTGEAVNTILDNVGAGGRRFPPQASEPANPQPGDVYLQDGGNWDPAGNAGNAALVIYDGSSWQLVADVGTDLS